MLRPTRGLLVLALALALAVSLAPASAAASPQGQLAAQVRVVNALVGAPAVNVMVDGIPAGPPLVFGADPQYVPVPPGTHTIGLMPAGAAPPAPLLTTEITVASGNTYSLFAMGGAGTSPQFLALDDKVLGGLGDQAAVRFVNASPDAPAVDIALPDGTMLASGIAYGQARPYILVPSGTVAPEVLVAGTSTVLGTIPVVQARPGRRYTLAAVGLTSGDPPLAFVSMRNL